MRARRTRHILQLFMVSPRGAAAREAGSAGYGVGGASATPDPLPGEQIWRCPRGVVSGLVAICLDLYGLRGTF